MLILALFLIVKKSPQTCIYDMGKQMETIDADCWVLDLTSNSMSSLPDLSRNVIRSELRVADNLLSNLPDLRRNTVLLEVDIAGILAYP